MRQLRAAQLQLSLEQHYGKAAILLMSNTKHPQQDAHARLKLV